MAGLVFETYSFWVWIRIFYPCSKWPHQERNCIIIESRGDLFEINFRFSVFNQLARQLESVNEIKEPLKSNLLNGKWELLYTTSQSILKTKVGVVGMMYTFQFLLSFCCVS